MYLGLANTRRLINFAFELKNRRKGKLCLHIPLVTWHHLTGYMLKHVFIHILTGKLSQKPYLTLLSTQISWQNVDNIRTINLAKNVPFSYRLFFQNQPNSFDPSVLQVLIPHMYGCERGITVHQTDYVTNRVTHSEYWNGKASHTLLMNPLNGTANYVWHSYIVCPFPACFMLLFPARITLNSV